MCNRSKAQAVLLALLAGLAAPACGGSTSVVPAPRPVADAGLDVVARVNELLVLDGRGTRDVAGRPLAYAWRQVEGPLDVGPADATTERPGFVPAVPGTYVFELVVTDFLGIDSAPDRVTVLVIDDDAAQPRRAPAAEPRAAGIRQVVFLAFDPPDLQAQPPTIVLADGAERQVTIVDLASDPTDDPAAAAIVGTECVRIERLGTHVADVYAPVAPDDEPPTSMRFDAATTAIVSRFGVVGEAFVLDGTHSQDDGVIQTFTWTQVGGPLQYETQAPLLSVVPLTAGTYEFDLVVTDDTGLSSFARRITVPVLPAGAPTSGPPTARTGVLSGATADPAGGEAWLATVGTEVVLTGAASLSLATGDPRPAAPDLSYSWRQTEGPRALLGAGEAQTVSVVPPQAGSYEFELSVTDAHGVTARRSMPLAAGPSGTTARLVSLAPGGVVALGQGLPPPVLSLVATPSVAQPGLEYAWSQVRGPPVVLSETTPGMAEFTPVTPGIYEFAVRVFDGHVFTPTARTTWRVR